MQSDFVDVRDKSEKISGKSSGIISDTISGEESDIISDKISGAANDKINEKSGTELGIAIDIGTTTIALSLVDLDSRNIINTYTSLNHQRKFGADVIARIKASNDGNGEALRSVIQKDLLKAAILTGFSGGALAVLFQLLLAPDVALTQAIVGAAIVPVFLALAVKKTQRDGS